MCWGLRPAAGPSRTPSSIQTICISGWAMFGVDICRCVCMGVVWWTTGMVEGLYNRRSVDDHFYVELFGEWCSLFI